MEVKVEEVTKICHTIEEEIVKMYGDTGQKYKTKYRSLIFNLKDPKNRVRIYFYGFETRWGIFQLESPLV